MNDRGIFEHFDYFSKPQVKVKIQDMGKRLSSPIGTRLSSPIGTRPKMVKNIE